MTAFPNSLPAPAHPDPRDAPVLRWGILGPGLIAGHFVAALMKHTGQQVTAVASRTAQRAADFADSYGIAQSYGSYEDLLADDTVDAVYIATPMSEHYAQTVMCVQAGKHALVEKSFMRTAAEAVEVRELARAGDVFVMEAMKTRYIPQVQVIDRLLADGVFGTVDSVVAQYGGVVPFQAGHRVFDPALGGGVLLDIGVYPLSFAYTVLGAFTSVKASGTLAASGVDDSASAVLTTESGARALVETTLRASTPIRASINGSLARVESGEPFHNPSPLSLISADGLRRLDWNDQRYPGRECLAFEASAMARYVADGLTESPVHGLDDSVAIMTLLDEMRRQVGARFTDEL
ncbi:Gfo/Idh/MocA family protein [Glaciibacter sp. 2TAF33]|uniref:Gfo/Idh/MocA family protein n=1 Tax=Glaciibacter sp. 2TAF33 TaxID=3233015 RepID=UPI003F8F5297